MYENNTIDETRINKNNIYGKTRTKSKKSEFTLGKLKERLDGVSMDISKFSGYFGISRPTIYGWKNHGIPLYIERIIELLEIKKALYEGIENLSEINTDKINELYEIDTNEPKKSKKWKSMKSA